MNYLGRFLVVLFLWLLFLSMLGCDSLNEVSLMSPSPASSSGSASGSSVNPIADAKEAVKDFKNSGRTPETVDRPGRHAAGCGTARSKFSKKCHNRPK